MVVKAKIRSAAESHPGVIRQNNEDRVHSDPERGIFLVIDGIGGHAAGEKAAEIAMNRVRGRLERQTGSPEDRIREAITVANNEIFREAATNPEWKGMACVLTVALVDNDTAFVGHVGDSRLYKIRRGEIRKITHDHSPVGEREDNQEISETEAMRHPRRNEVYRDVGSEEHAPDDPDFIEILRIPFEPDSALLLCSDGLSDQVTSAEILRTIQENAGHPYSAVHELIDAANRAGGKDNVSVLIVEGEQFAAARPVTVMAPPASGNPLTSRLAIAVYSIVAAALSLAALHHYGFFDPRPAPPPRPAQTLRVGNGGLSSIGEALDKAQAGDTVEVASGEYPEHVRLKTGVTLKGQWPDMPILRASAIETGAAGAVTADGVKGARMSGFRILADEKAPLAAGVVVSNSDLELEDNEIVGAGTGIDVRGDSHAILRANTIQDCRDLGIRISGNSAPYLLGNSILRNGRKARDSGAGVLVEAPAQPVLKGNTFADNGAQQVRLPQGMDNATIQKFNHFISSRSRGGTTR